MRVRTADSYAEREVAATMLADVCRLDARVTLGTDRNYYTRGFVSAYRKMKETPHVARKTRRTGGSTIATTPYASDDASASSSALAGGKPSARSNRGLAKVNQLLTLTMAAYNLARLQMLPGKRQLGANQAWVIRKQRQEYTRLTGISTVW